MKILTFAFLFLSTLYASNPILTEVRMCAAPKDEIAALINELEVNHFVLKTSSDDDLRVKFVHLQGAIEHVLAKFQAEGKIQELLGIIHTPLPATPLCTQLNETNNQAKADKWQTVLSRATILREYLSQGSKLFVVYPQGGLEKRTSEQQQTYAQTLMEFAPNLSDWTLNTTEIDPDMIGATYLFLDNDYELYGFSIKARQFNDQQPKSEWGIWFGPIAHPEVQARLDEVFGYLISVGGPEI